MPRNDHRLRLGVVGCGAIGSRIAISTTKELSQEFKLSALYDIDPQRSQALSRKFRTLSLCKKSLSQLIRASDVIVEAVNTTASKDIVFQSLSAGKTVLCMSVGCFLSNRALLKRASRTKGTLLLPSGAIAGLDAVKAASVLGIRSLTLTTTKPPKGFYGNEYIKGRGIDPAKIRCDTVLFDGDAQDAVIAFPQNINVAAALAIAAGPRVRVRVKIVASPQVTRNTHEIVAAGPFGRITTRTENEIFPDNPKTSYLAGLSAIATLKSFGQRIKIGV
jgi:aspartate dehydrogenase